MKIYSTIPYGQGMDECEKPEKKEPKDITEFYDMQEECEKNKKNLIDYHIHKIYYTIGKDKNIQSLKFEYMDRNTGEVKVLLDTVNSHIENENPIEITFTSLEEIKLIRFWVNNDDSLCGFSIETTDNQIKKIGFGEDTELIKDFNLEGGSCRILGFACHSNKERGITGMFCYYMPIKKYGLVVYGGILRLRAKIKKDSKFRDELMAKKDTLPENEKLILGVCDLPDTAFFPAALYLMSL